MKTLFPSQFGHDHFSDRVQVLLLAQSNYDVLPRHVRALDVVGETPDGLVSLKDLDECFIFMEEASGKDYFQDLNRILQRESLEPEDLPRAKALAEYLADIHAVKYDGPNAKVLYRRRIRDLVGHGECAMGIVDAYEEVPFAAEAELVAYAGKCLAWWGKIRNRSERLCQVHGDFHPGNIWFREDGFTLLDRSRGSWGEPGDDVSCMAVNYITYAVKHTGTFEGPFAELLRAFVTSYLDRTHDEAIFEVMPPFFAFRILVIANPAFYPDDTVRTKRRLLDFGHAVLGADRFELDRIPEYLGG